MKKHLRVLAWAAFLAWSALIVARLVAGPASGWVYFGVGVLVPIVVAVIWEVVDRRKSPHRVT